MNHPGKLMWGCVAVLVVAGALAIALTAPFYLVFALPCVLMIGAMLWMMGGRMGGG